MFYRYKYIIIAILLILLGVLLYFSFSHKKVIPQQEVKQEPVANPKIDSIGNSVEGRKIESYTYGTGKYHVVFVGGIHGGYEWNSVLLAYQAMDYLDKDLSRVPKNVTITIIPSMNPDGVYKVIGKEGRFDSSDVSTDANILADARFNANKVDLNRNFDCKWQPESKWRNQTVSAGKTAFSEPESIALKNFAEKIKPDALVFWHSQANGVFGASCGNGVLPQASTLMNLYSKASGYPSSDTFDSYEVTGDAADWLSKIGISAFEVELKTHEAVEFDKNILGINALLKYFGSKTN
ncbi:MAG: M14 family metallopeptidase [Patescibacteria group bacterium]